MFVKPKKRLMSIATDTCIIYDKISRTINQSVVIKLFSKIGWTKYPTSFYLDQILSEGRNPRHNSADIELIYEHIDYKTVIVESVVSGSWNILFKLQIKFRN